MAVGPNPFEYFFLISNTFILFIFYFHFYKNRHWFLRTYIIGKSIQLAGIYLLEIGKMFSFMHRWDIVSILFIICFPFEIFGIISYNGNFNRRTFYIFLYTTLFLCLADLILIFMQLRGEIMTVSTIFFYTYGGIVLLRINDKSRFRYLIGISFIVHSLFSIIITTISILHIGQHPIDVNIAKLPPHHINIQESYSNFIYFVMLVSSIGYLVILKEQDEFALDAANKRINEENIELKRIHDEKNKFFSIIAHDLRSPIGTLAKLTEMLVSTKARSNFKESDFEKWLDLINQTSAKTYTLLNNLLQWARSESGRLIPHPEIINLKEIIDEVLLLKNATAVAKNIQLINNCPDHVEIFADREMVLTILRNLLSNAIKYTFESGTILVDASSGVNTVISIKDNGIGMNDEIKKNLFALDFKYSTPGTNKEEGSGLGLKLSYEFVKKNNGSIWVESSKGQGTTFYVSLPAKDNADKSDR